MMDSSTKVFGIGFARTGTTTLGAALRTLGYRHMGCRMDLLYRMAAGDDDIAIDEAIHIAAEYDSFEDWPWSLLYKEMDQAYPGSKFITTLRPFPSWVKSYRNMIDRPIERGRPPSPELRLARSYLFGKEEPTDEALLACHKWHLTEIDRYFGQSDRHLFMSWFGGDGWPELCRFLGRPIPHAPFPHENKGRYALSSPA